MRYNTTDTNDERGSYDEYDEYDEVRTERRERQHSGYGAGKARNDKRIYEFDSAERKGRYVRIID